MLLNISRRLKEQNKIRSSIKIQKRKELNNKEGNMKHSKTTKDWVTKIGCLSRKKRVANADIHSPNTISIIINNSKSHEGRIIVHQPPTQHLRLQKQLQILQSRQVQTPCLHVSAHPLRPTDFNYHVSSKTHSRAAGLGYGARPGF